MNKLTKLCNVAALYCVSSPCQNGATCREGLNAPVCECRGGYAGNTCEKGSINPRFNSINKLPIVTNF